MYQGRYGKDSDTNKRRSHSRRRLTNKYMSNMDFNRYTSSTFGPLIVYGPERKKPKAHEFDTKIREKRKTCDGKTRDDKGEQGKEKEKPKEKPEKEKEKKEEKPRAKEEELRECLHVESIDLHISENTRKHHTNEYANTEKRKGPNGEEEDEDLVVRRGQTFKMTATLNYAYNCEVHDMKLLFKTGKTPKANKGSLVTVPVSETSTKPDNDCGGWSATIEKIDGKYVHLLVYISPDCLINVWELGITTITDVKRGKDKIYYYECPTDVFILLNPWSPDDSVYMSPPVLLDEYVLNSVGAVFRGNSRQVGTKPWNFAQFDEGILEICLHLVRKGFGDTDTPNKHQGDPIKLARIIAQIVNNCDDGGVLVGRWDGDYKPHTKPTYWKGSAEILKKYSDDGEPVKYGQCWVFSALTTTVCRAIGLPCRSVTNFSSAHDTDGSLTIDRIGYLCPDTGCFEPIPDECDDSVWNFHVWNDVWMCRPDLEGYDGWQAIDATPQERSEGQFTCGPAPLKAIKNGDCCIPYDVGFVFAEVNADRVQWVYTNETDWKIHSVDKRSVGKRLSTKTATGKALRSSLSIYGNRKNEDEEDVIYQYKYPEGTEEERKAVDRACQFAVAGSRPYDVIPEEEMDCSIDCEDGILIGSDFTGKVKVKNLNSSSTKKVTVNLLVRAVSYTGCPGRDIKKIRYSDEQLKPKEEESFEIPVSVPEYMNLLDEQFGMRVYASVVVKDSLKIISKEDDFRLRKPDLDIKIPSSCKAGEKVKVTISFTNPLPCKLTDCSLELDGRGFIWEKKTFTNIGDIAPKSEWKFETSFQALRTGDEKQMSAEFDCEELPEISGCTTIDVLSK